MIAPYQDNSHFDITDTLLWDKCDRVIAEYA